MVESTLIMDIQIGRDNLRDGQVVSLLNQHLSQMGQYSPKESIHALDNKQLKDASISFWSARVEDRVVGCGALKAFAPRCGEVKSMKTHPAYIRKGIAALLLEAIISEAKIRGYRALYLETGTHEAFNPAVALYRSFGFNLSQPFGEYQFDPYSQFFKKSLL